MNKIKSLFKTFLKFADSNKQRPAVYMGHNVVLTKTIYGQKLYVNSEDLSLAPHIICDGYWEIWITQAIQSIIKEGMVVVEIGANFGYYTTLMSSLVGTHGEVHAFEANPRLFNLLSSNIDINGFLDRTKVINKAVHEKQGQSEFFTLRKHQGSSSVLPFEKETLAFYNDEMDNIIVPTITLCEYWRHQKKSIDVVKIDAEGSEPFIINGMKDIISSQEHLIIICEFNKLFFERAQQSTREFFESFLRQGFSLNKIDHAGQIVPVTANEIIRSPNQEELVLQK